MPRTKRQPNGNRLGLMKGDLEACFEKNDKTLTRRLEADRTYSAAGGGELTLCDRSLLFVRNVGHRITTPAVRLPDDSEEAGRPDKFAVSKRAHYV